MAIKDEARAARELGRTSKPKKKKPPAVVPTRQPRSAPPGIRHAEALPGADSRPALTPMGEHYGFEGGTLSRLWASRQTHLENLGANQATMSPEQVRWERDAIKIYEDAVHALSSDVEEDEALDVIKRLQENITLNTQWMEREGIDPATDMGVYHQEAISNYADAVERLQEKYGPFISRDELPAGTVRRPDEGTRGRTPYKGKPNPAFQRIGFAGSIFDFNKKAQLADLAFEAQFGYKPTPGLLLDIVRGPVSTEELEDLFKIPSSFQRARAAGAIEAERSGALAIPKDEGGPNRDLTLVEEFEGQQEEDIEAGGVSQFYDLQNPDPTFLEEMTLFERIVGTPVLAIQQMTSSALLAPVGLALLSKEAGLDVFDITTGRDFTPGRSLNMAGAYVESVKADFRDPLENPGYLLLDIVGFASAGAGGVARLGAAGRAGSASRAVRAGLAADVTNLRPQTLAQIGRGNTARATLSALVRRPNAGTIAIGPKGAEERVLLSENALRRVIQRGFYAVYQRQLIKHLEASPDVVRSQHWLKELRKSIISPERTLGRTANARVRVERDVLMAPVHKLNKAAGTGFHLAAVYRRLPFIKGGTPEVSPFGLTLGEEMALLFKATDDPDPASFWQGFHENMLELRQGDPNAHLAKLAAIPLGIKALQKPSKRLRRAIEAADGVSREMQSLKISYLGLDPTDAENRIAVSAEAGRQAAQAVSKSDLFQSVDDVISGPPLTRILDESFYYPEVRRHDAPIFPKEQTIGSVRGTGKYGTPVPNLDRLMPELSHRYTGAAIRAGDTILDARMLFGSAYAKAAKGVTLVEDWKRLLALSVETPNAPLVTQGGFLRPIRTLDGIPEELRTQLAPFFEERGHTPKQAAEFADNPELEKLHKWFFPDATDIEAVEGVRYVDERFFADLHRFPGEPSAAHKAFIVLNEPAKAVAIYGKPSYAINALSNAGMLLMQEGFLAPVYMYKSLRANKELGRDVVAIIDHLIGEGKTRSYSPHDLKAAKLSRNLARLWAPIVDTWMRRAAFIFEAEKKGYKTADDYKRLLDQKNRGDDIVADRVEISRRSNKAMVEMNNLSWWESQYLREAVFVYPWVSRSAVWAVRTWLERPIKTWAASELGQIGEEYVEETLAEAQEKAGALVPSWFKDSGYVPVPIGGDRVPWIVNVNSINTFSTMSSLVQTFEGAFTDDPFHGLSDLLGPGAEVIVGAITKRDRFGRPYEHGILGAPADVFGNLPQVRAYARSKDQKPKLGPDGKPVSVESNLQNVTSTGQVAPPDERPTFIPGGFLETWGPIVLGTLSPRKPDLEALQEDYWKEQPQAVRDEQRQKIASQRLMERTKNEMRTIRGLEEVTSKVLGKPIPEGVHNFLQSAQKLQFAIAEFSVQKRRSPTVLEERAIQIKLLEQEGRIDPDKARQLRSDLKEATKTDTLDEFKQELNDNYYFAQEMRDWHKERDTVMDVANNLQTQATFLRSIGVWNGEVPQNANLLTKSKLDPTRTQIKKSGGVDFDPDSPLYQVGRAFLDYQTKLAAREPADASYMEGVSGAEFRTWLDTQDNEISIDGKKYPSPVRLDWASKILNGTLDDPDYERKQLDGLTAQGWESLTDFEKELVGRKPAPGVSRGYLILEAVLGGFRGNVTKDDVDHIALKTVDGTQTGKLSDVVPDALPQGQRDIERDHRIAIAKWISKNFVPGFWKDYEYAIRPKYQRISVLPQVAQSKEKEDWVELLTYAHDTYRQIATLRANDEDGIGELQDQWRDYVSRTLFPWLKENNPEFLVELTLFGGEDFARTLIE